MQAYPRAALSPLTAASPVSSVASRTKAGDLASASTSAARPLDVVTAAQTLASLLLGGLTDQDLAVFAGRLLPHLQEGQLDRAQTHSAYTVASLAAELGVSDKAVRCAIARHELRAVKRGSRWIISADAVSEWATAPEAARRRPAGALLRSLPFRRRRAPRCAQSSAEKAKRRVAEVAEARDERREGNACGWRSRLACAVAPARQEPCANVQHAPGRPRLRRGGPTATPGRKPSRTRCRRRDLRRIRHRHLGRLSCRHARGEDTPSLREPLRLSLRPYLGSIALCEITPE